MSGDFEYSDQYTPTIDDNLTNGKAITEGIDDQQDNVRT
jgi:hypothetical protein